MFVVPTEPEHFSAAQGSAKTDVVSKPHRRTHVRVTSITSVITTATSHSGDEFDELQLHGAVPVRNTFIDYPLSQQRRRIASAPYSSSAGASPPASPASASSALSVASASPPPLMSAPSAPVLPAPRNFRNRQLTPAMLAALGTPSLPTVGSVSHGKGKCKPCAFLWKDCGCQSGIDCHFCHLCDVDERKMRRKEKASKAAERRRAREATTPAVAPFDLRRMQ